ncbi:DUF1482 family protein [Lelliottia sp. SL45]|uniref:DUF1482 family protein n=1 Tax=Lelliottia sp. SL45 TaxID=2994665 RepID=UPI003FA3798B
MVITLLAADGSRVDVVKDIFETKEKCNQVIFEERVFNGACYQVDKIIHQNESE